MPDKPSIQIVNQVPESKVADLRYNSETQELEVFIEQGVGVPTTGVESSGQCDAGSQILYGLLEARGAYTPASAEVFTVELEVYPLK